MKHAAEYRIMLCYLELIYHMSQTEALGGLLGDMSLLQDGHPVDPAIEYDWEDSVRLASETIQTGAGVTTADITQTAAVCFLERWLAVGIDADIKKVCNDLRINKYDELWKQAVQMVEASADAPYIVLNK